MTRLSVERVDAVARKAGARLRVRTLLPFYDCKFKSWASWKSVVGRNNKQSTSKDDSDTSLSIHCALCTSERPGVLQHYYSATCRQRQRGLIFRQSHQNEQRHLQNNWVKWHRSGWDVESLKKGLECERGRQGHDNRTIFFFYIKIKRITVRRWRTWLCFVVATGFHSLQSVYLASLSLVVWNAGSKYTSMEMQTS